MKRKRKADEKRTKWQHCRDEEQKLEEILAQRRMEGSSLQLEFIPKVLEFVVHERMSQGKWSGGASQERRKYQDGL